MTTLANAFRPEPRVVDEAVADRRRLHRRPELSGAENETTTFIRERLQRLGLQQLPCPTPTGALALLETGRPGRRVLLRADIDALPIQEGSGVSFESEVPGRMHACGHDAHTAILLWAAAVLSAARELSGSYAFCFQPAEETLRGGRAMVDGGLLEMTRPDRVIGLHVASFLPSGEVFARPGMQHAWAAGFRIVVRGRGGHSATGGSELTRVVGEMCLRVPGIADGLEHEGCRALAAVGSVITDGAWNVSPTEATLSGTHRAFTAEHHAILGERLSALADGVSAELHVDATTPAVVNDRSTVAELEAVCAQLGVACARLEKPLVFADDVSEMLSRVPGCYFMLGARPPDQPEGEPHHSPQFRIDETPIQSGMTLLSTLAATLA